MSKRVAELTQSRAGSLLGHTCPNCVATVANVAQGVNFGEYVPMPKSGKGSRSKPSLSNWLFYGVPGEWFLFTDADDNPCEGKWGRHYHMNTMETKKGGGLTGRRVGFLWFRGE